MDWIPAAIRMHEILKGAEAQIYKETGMQVDLKVMQANLSMSAPAIASTVAIALNVELSQMCSETRFAPAREARQIAMYLCHKFLPNHSPRAIAEAFERDRTTLYHTMEVVQNMIDTNDQLFITKLQTAEQAVIQLYNETKDNTHTA
jgi:chromosomal replication initiation ATPase DnaA